MNNNDHCYWNHAPTVNPCWDLTPSPQNIWHLQALQLVESDRHQSQCNSCFACFVGFIFFQCGDKNGDLCRVDSFAPCGFTTFLQETWNIRGGWKIMAISRQWTIYFFNFCKQASQPKVGSCGTFSKQESYYLDNAKEKNVPCHRHQAVHDQCFNSLQYHFLPLAAT